MGPGVTQEYTVVLVNTSPAGADKAQNVKIGIPAGFTFVSLTSAVTSNNGCGTNGAVWGADGTLFSGGNINLKWPGGGANELCQQGGTLTVKFQATSPAAAGDYTFVTQMLRGAALPFIIVGDQPVVTVKLNQTISFGALGGKTFGDADFAVSATASSELARCLRRER